MTVEKQLGEFAAHLAREVDEVGLDLVIARVFSKIADPISDTAQSLLASGPDRTPAVGPGPGGLAGAQHSTSSLRTDIPGQFELAVSRALAGDPAGAPRAAEIAELLHEPRQAAWWWLRAAVGGDEVAQDYVHELNIQAQDAEPPVMLPRTVCTAWPDADSTPVAADVNLIATAICRGLSGDVHPRIAVTSPAPGTAGGTTTRVMKIEEERR